MKKKTSSSIITRKFYIVVFSIIALVIIIGFSYYFLEGAGNSGFKGNDSEKCQPPKRIDVKCSELSQQECENSSMCYTRKKSCLTPPAEYVDALDIVKKNCKISGGKWIDNVNPYLNNFGSCKCTKGSEEKSPLDGFCDNSFSNSKEKKELPKIFYNYYNQIHDEKVLHYRGEGTVIDGVRVDPLTVSFNPDYDNLNEAKYIACLFDGEIVGTVPLIDGYTIKFGNKTKEQAMSLVEKIEKEPSVDFVLIGVEMGH